MNDQPEAESSFWQHVTFTTANIFVSDGIQIRDPNKQATADPLLRPRGYRDHQNSVTDELKMNVKY